MDILSTKEMLAQEEDAFRHGVSAAALMEAAGAAMAARIREIYPNARDYLVLVGKGNNGGDGLVVARHLARSSNRVAIILAAPETDLGELPIAQIAKLRAGTPGVKILLWDETFAYPGSDGVVIDALLGLQASGDLREPVAEIVALTNAARAAHFFRTVALDLPSGLSAFEDTPAPTDRDAAIVADITIAVGFPKEVLVRESLSAWVGRLEVVAWSAESKITAKPQILVGPELAELLPRRSALSYKGDYGKLAIIAGSRGFTGAAILCTQSAQAMGAGLLSVVTHADVAPIIAAHAPPEAMVSGWEKIDETPEVVEKASALVLGPGLGTTDDTLTMLRAALKAGCPLLIDADGLNVLAKNLDLLAEAKGPVVLTPHVGEMARLIDRKFSPDERDSVAREFVEKYPGVTLVLKGTRTLVTAAGAPHFINTTGNPGLSTGGSGDTLSGIIGALLAQGLKPLDAARLGVWLHGHAADLALTERGCEEGLTPTMLSAHLGAALVSLRAQAAPRAGLLESLPAEKPHR